VRKRLLLALAPVLALLAATVAPAQAINYGQVDDGAHPYVALIALFDENDEYIGRCSGSLIDEDVVLTAAHCTDGVAYAHIFFDEDLRNVDVATSTDYDAIGYPHAMDGWTGSLTVPDTHDVAVYTLDREITDIDPAQIAPVGFLDEMATRDRETYFTTVGYGLQQRKPYLINEKIRMYATSNLINLQNALVRDYGLQTTNNPGWHQRRQLLRRLRRPDPVAEQRPHRRRQQLRAQRRLQGQRLLLPDRHPRGARLHHLVPRLGQLPAARRPAR
jgi:hypothetical protein